MPKSPITRWDKAQGRLRRRLELLRGWWLRQQGAQAGERFGLGPGLQALYPACLTVGNDVTIEGPGYLHCLSEQGVQIGAHTSIARNVWLHCGGTPIDYGHGYFVIGHHSFIGPNAVLGAGGGITIGNHVQIGPNVQIVSEEHNFGDHTKLIYEQGVRYTPVTIRDNVWIGTGVVILAGVEIGEGAVVGAGSVVTKSISSMSIAVGVPARIIKKRIEHTEE